MSVADLLPATPVILEDTQTFPVVSVDTFVKSESPEAGVFATAYYTQPNGLRLRSLESTIRKSDTFDGTWSRLSEDNGRTWSAAVELESQRMAGDLVTRIMHRGGVSHPVTGDYLEFASVATTPAESDHPANRKWQVCCAVSSDGGYTLPPFTPLIHAEPGFDEAHPFPGIWRGQNAMLLGDFSCRPLVLEDGRLVVAAQNAPLDETGQLINPRQTNGYYEAMFVEGRPLGEGQYSWKLLSRISGLDQLDLSPRGVFEPTLATLTGGRWLCVMRGNGGRRLFATSKDAGITWSRVEPWSFDDDEVPYSPSSCSQLVQHSSGALYWLGNLCVEQPQDNSPRYPFWTAEVDLQSGLLKRSTLSKIDDRQPDETEKLTLSNFYAREDRETGDILLHLPRFFAHDSTLWGADALLYRIKVKPT